MLNQVLQPIIRKPVFLVLALFISGCASTAIENEKAIQAKLAGHTAFTPQSWATQVDDFELAQARDVDWLDSFQDPVLTDLVKQALANNRDLMAASANVDRANALAQQAGARLKPQVDLTLGSSRTESASGSESDFSTQTLGVQLSWEVDLWGRIRAGQEAAVASADAAAADYRYAQHSLSATTAKAYFVAIEANLQTEILKDILASLEETFRIVNVQYENGITSAQDVALTKSDLAFTREQLITLEGTQRESLRALEVLLGRYPEGAIALSKGLPTLPPMPSTGVPSEVLERRPDLIASERRVAAAFNSVQQSKAARLPSLSLTTSLGGSSSSLSDILSPANVVWQLAGNLLAPIFDGGTRRAQVDISTAEQKQALANYAQTALTAFNEVETNLDLANTLTLRKTELQISLDAAKKAYRIAQLRHKEGEIGLIDLLSVQQRVLSAQSNLTSVTRLALDQRINLYLALGGDWKTL